MKASTSSGIVLSAATLLLTAAPFQGSGTAASPSASAALGVSAVVSASCIISAVSVGRGHLIGVPTALTRAWAVTTACTDGTNAVVSLGRIGALGTSPLRAIANGPNSMACPLCPSTGRRTFVWDAAAAPVASETGLADRIRPHGWEAAATSHAMESSPDVMVATLTL